MTTRTSLLAAGLLAAAIAPSLALAAPSAAATNDGWHFVGGEAGWVYESPRLGVARSTVSAPVVTAGRHAPAYDGWRFVGGEAGWVLETPRFDVVDGRLVHAETCQFKPAVAALTPPAAPGGIDGVIYGGA
jgi:hypothetical protein